MSQKVINTLKNAWFAIACLIFAMFLILGIRYGWQQNYSAGSYFFLSALGAGLYLKWLRTSK